MFIICLACMVGYYENKHSDILYILSYNTLFLINILILSLDLDLETDFKINTLIKYDIYSIGIKNNFVLKSK